MSVFPGGPTGAASEPEVSSPPPQRSGPRKRSLAGSLWFYCWTSGAALLAVTSLLVVGVFLYISTPHFSNLVRQRIITALADATGGRVELQSFTWSVRRLTVQADGLTIHGLEGPGEAPYAHVDRLYVQLKILALLRPKVSLRYLEADHPTIHLIVYPDGSTNQPTPHKQRTSEKSVTDAIFDLQAERVEVHDGLAVINQRSVPFSLTARDTRIVVTYSQPMDQYLGHVQVSDLSLQRDSAPPLASNLLVDLQLARNSVELKTLTFSSAGSTLKSSGSLVNFAAPQWKLTSQGRVDLREISALVPLDGKLEGIANIELEGQGMPDEPFLVDGNIRLSDAGYRTSYLDAGGVNAAMRLRMSPQEIALDGLTARLRDGGNIDAAVRFLHWNTAAAPSKAPSPSAPRKARAGTTPPRFTANIRAYVRGVRLPTVLRMVAIPQFQDLGVDTSADGPVNVDWTGSADDLTVGAKMQLTAPPAAAPGDIPLSGMVDARYLQRTGGVDITQLEARTPGMKLEVTGSLGVYPITASSALNVNLSTTNLAEFDRALTDLGLAWQGKKGVAAIPVALRGIADFTGTVNGSVIDPDVKGHLTATNFSTKYSLPTATSSQNASSPSTSALRGPNTVAVANAAPNPSVKSVEWDRLDAVGEYSSSAISIDRAYLTGRGAEIDFRGRLGAHQISARKSAFDEASPLVATAQIRTASVTDLLALAGQSAPVTGIVNLQAHVTGTVGNPTGSGDIEILGGELAGEPYHSAHANLVFSEQHLNLAKLTLLQDGGTVTANGTYDLRSKTFLANVDGTNFELAHLRTLQTASMRLSGSLKFDAHASGTIEAPSVLLGVHVANLTIQGQPAGGLELLGNTQGDIVHFTGHSTLISARLELGGQTVLRGDFPTKAKLAVSGFDIGPLLEAFGMQSAGVHSQIGGEINITGPAKEPKEMGGEAVINQFSATMQGLTLTSQGPLRASLKEGVLHVIQAHITGPDTNLTMAGSAGLMGNRDLDLNASGSINMKVAQTFDHDITSSGHVDFNMEAAGSLTRPSLTGQVRLSKVNIALADIPNGLSNLEGTLVFNQDRLEVQNVVGTTGGGQLKLGGFITYRQGIYGDLTATGKDVRIRYSGLSATTDATFHLQGSQNNMLLSGNVLITRFIIGPNLDFAMFAGSPAASAPPNPTSASSHVRLDVHIVSSPQLDFQNSYAQLAGSVDLYIRGTIAQPAVLGHINIAEGSATFAGTTYQLQRGDIYFTNPVRIDPVIDLDATAHIEEYDVVIGLHGSSSHLTPTFRSEPPLPQADIISLLALGRTQQEQDVYNQAEAQAGSNATTNALLGGALNAATSRVSRLFGVGSVKIDPTYVGNLGNSTARITVQQNISRTVQLTYATNVNTTSEQLIQAQVNLTDNVSVLAVRDEVGVFSMVVKIHQRFR